MYTLSNSGLIVDPICPLKNTPENSPLTGQIYAPSIFCILYCTSNRLRLALISTSSTAMRLSAIRAISRTRGSASTLPPRRLLSTPTARPHPLSPPLPKSPRSNSSVSTQKWSTLTAVLLATLTGGITYALGFQSALSSPKSKSVEGGEGVLSYREPTAEGFKQAMIELEQFLPKDCMRGDRESLEEHGHSVWSRGCTIS